MDFQFFKSYACAGSTQHMPLEFSRKLLADFPVEHVEISRFRPVAGGISLLQHLLEDSTFQIKLILHFIPFHLILLLMRYFL